MPRWFPFDRDEWPELLIPLVRQYGPGRVWTVGLRRLGYPPTWITSGLEFLTLRETLEKAHERAA